jgi:hypothetical protein
MRKEQDMFYHIVMMRFTDTAGAEFHRQVEAYAGRIRRDCGGLIHYDYGMNVASRGKGFDRVILAVFESSAAHDRYQVSPAHQDMKAYMTPFIGDLVVCDSDVPQPSHIPAARGGSS